MDENTRIVLLALISSIPVILGAIFGVKAHKNRKARKELNNNDKTITINDS